MTKKLKISSTAYRVLVLLLNLNSGLCKLDLLNKIFITDEYISRYFSKDVILKYITTLRALGYNISRPCIANNYNYELSKSPVLAELSNKSIKNIAIMYCYAESFHQNKIIEDYTSFIKKIKKFIPEKQVIFLNKELKKQKEALEKDFYRYLPHKDLIERIESYKAENQRVSVSYLNSVNNEKLQVVLELKNIKYDHKEVFVIGYSPITGQNISIFLKQIIDIKQLPSKSQYTKTSSPLIYKLKGNLANVYRPYQNEKIMPDRDDPGSIIVTAYEDDKDLLIKRLLRYGENTEILYPKQAKNQMNNIIKQTLKNYEEI